MDSGLDQMGGPGTDVVTASYEHHAAAVRGVAQRMTRDPELAADVTQEAFLRLFLETSAGRTPDNIGAWLYRTSANLIVSHARHVAVARRTAPRLVRLDGPVQPDAEVVAREQDREMRLALATLPSDYRDALVLAAEGASGADIARSLGRTGAATRTLLCRARRRLRAEAGLFDGALGAA
jgi:RNA polymerase sigma factor (sigma-70 family)